MHMCHFRNYPIGRPPGARRFRWYHAPANRGTPAPEDPDAVDGVHQDLSGTLEEVSSDEMDHLGPLFFP